MKNNAILHPDRAEFSESGDKFLEDISFSWTGNADNETLHMNFRGHNPYIAATILLHIDDIEELKKVFDHVISIAPSKKKKGVAV